MTRLTIVCRQIGGFRHLFDRNLSYQEAIFQTSDGGRTWTSIHDPSGPDFLYHCHDSIQLLTPTVGIDDDAPQPGLGGTPLEVTDNDGHTRTPPYGLAQGATKDVPNADVLFENPDDAIALGSQPYSNGPGVEVSYDGGHTWTDVFPPAPADAKIIYS